MADKQIKVCDRCEAFDAKAREVLMENVPPYNRSKVKADLCDVCWCGVDRAVKRAMSKPVARKGTESNE